MTKTDPYLHAVLLLYGVEKEINESNIVSVLKAAGIDVDNAKAKFLAEAVKGINIEELLKNASVVAVAPTATEAKKEEKPKEDTAKKEEQAAEGLANLFG